jgi:DNA-binding NarL/FixJ family response regulator
MRRRQSFATILIGKSILLREGLARILRSANFRILVSASGADDLLTSTLQPKRPLFLIVHTGADFDSALEQIKVLRDRHPSGRIAIVADHYRLADLVSAFRAGANGYFVNVMTCDAFIKSIELVMMGETVFPPAFLSLALNAEGQRLEDILPRDENKEAIIVPGEDIMAPQLSPREKSILRCLIEGDSNKSIARKIDIAEATVKVHVKAILRKIRVQNRTQAAIWGMSNGSLARPANNSSLPATRDVAKQLPNRVQVVPQIKQIEKSVPTGVINPANHLDVARLDRLIGKSIDRTANGTVRLGK